MMTKTVFSLIQLILTNGERQRNIYMMHAMFQERSYMRGTFPELGLKEVFLKNENLGSEEIYLLIYNLLSFLPTSLD